MSEINEGAIVKGFSDALDQHKKSIQEDLMNVTKSSDFEALKEKHAKSTDAIEKSMKEMSEEVVKMRSQLVSKANEGKTELVKSINAFKGEGTLKEKFFAGQKMITKAVGTMTIGNNFTGQVTRFDQRPGIAGILHTSLDVRNLLRITTAVSDQYNFRKHTGGEGGIAPVAEATTKPQVDYDFANTAIPVIKIAGYSDISMEALDDTDGMEAFINNELVMDLKDVRNAQILYGTGAGVNMNGLATTAIDSTDSVIVNYPTVSAAQNWDALLAAIAALSAREYSPSIILLNPTDYFPMVGSKGTDGHYLRDMLVWNGGTPFLYGIPILVSTAVTAGAFIMWDQRAAEYAARKTAEISRSTENGTNFIDNVETFRIEERAALAKIYEDAVFQDTFAAVLAVIGV